MSHGNSGLFDGFQIFGKTDSSFAPSKDDKRMTHSMYNFNNEVNHNNEDNRSTSSHEDRVDPVQSFPSPPQSLPAMTFNTRPHDSVTRPHPQRKGTHNIPRPRISSHNQSLPSYNENNPRENKARDLKDIHPILQTEMHNNKPHELDTNSDLSALQNINFTQHTPPQITSPDLSPVKSDFFEKSIQDTKQLESKLLSLTASHTENTSQLKAEILEKETLLQSILQSSVEKLKDKLVNDVVLNTLNTKIDEAIGSNNYEEAENLKKKAESYPVVIIPFNLPRNVPMCKDIVESLNKARKSHIDSLKSYCVEIKEFGVKFDSTSKKIDAQCISKIEKSNQEFVAMETGIECRKQHLKIDQEYHNQQMSQLLAEKQTLHDEFTFQYKDQDEQLTDVRSEIKQLEEKLAILQSKEKKILGEQNKLNNEKISNDTNIKKQSSKLAIEKEELDMKSETLERDCKLLNEKRKIFLTSKSKIDQVAGNLSEIKSKVDTCKGEICEAISIEECGIVSDVQVSVNVDLSDSLYIPTELENVIKDICEKEVNLEEKSQAMFDVQKVIISLKSEEIMVRSEIENSKMLKETAVKIRNYSEAGEMSKKQNELETRLKDVSEEIGQETKLLGTISQTLEILTGEVKELKMSAEEKQKLFDTESFDVIKEKLEFTAGILRDLGDVESITKQLIEADVLYMCNYLKLIHNRYPNLHLDCEAIINEFGDNKSSKYKVEDLNVRIQKLKRDIEAAIQSENFDLADELNKELVSLDLN